MSRLSLVPSLITMISIASLVAACGGTADEGGGSGGGGGAMSSGGSTATGGAGSGGETGGGSGGDGSIDRSCDTGSDCTILSETCCGTCGAPSVEDMTAVRKGSESAYRDSVCEEPAICPACAAFPNPNLYSACEESLCVAKDLTQEAASECQTDGDCMVRVAQCCECGGATGPGELIALNPNNTSDYLGEVCDPVAECAACEVEYPQEVSAVCDAGVCKVVDSRL